MVVVGQGGAQAEGVYLKRLALGGGINLLKGFSQGVSLPKEVNLSVAICNVHRACFMPVQLNVDGNAYRILFDMLSGDA